METLTTAIQQDDTQAIKRALTSETLETPIDGQGMTPLAYAVEHQRPSAVALLLAKGADPMCLDASGKTPLLRALQGGRQTAELLLDAIVARGLIDDACRRLIMRVLMGRWVEDEDSRPCLDPLGIDRKTQGALFDQFDRHAAKLQAIAIAERLRAFCGAYVEMAAGLSPDTPDTETLFGFLMHDRDAEPVTAWLLALKARIAAGSRPDFAWQDYRPLLSEVRNLGEDQRTGEVYARWVMLEAPFFSIEALVAERIAAEVAINLDTQARAITRAARAGLFDLRGWILTIASGIDCAEGVDADNPWLALGDERTRAFMLEHPARLRNDAVEHLASVMDLLGSAFDDPADFVAALTPSQRAALAAHHLSAFKGQPGGWLAMARVLARDGLLPARLPARDDTVSWDGMADWLIAEVGSDLTLELLERIGADGARHRYRWSDSVQGQVQARVLSHWIEAHPDAVDRLRAAHLCLVGDRALLRRLILDSRCDSELQEAAIANLGWQLHGLAPDEELLASRRADCQRIWCEQSSILPDDWMDWFWAHRVAGDERALLIKAFSQAAKVTESEEEGLAEVAGPAFDRLRDWYLQDPALSDRAFSAIEEVDWRVANAAWDWLGPASRRAVLNALASELDGAGDYRLNHWLNQPSVVALLDRGMADDPAPLLAQRDAARWALRHLCEAGFEASLPQLQALASQKTVLPHAAKGLARISPGRLRDAGLLSDSRKAVRDLALRGLCERDDADAAPVLEDCLGERASRWTDIQRGHILDRLEHFGRDVSDLDPLMGADLAAFEAQALKGLKGKRSDALERLWNPRIEDLDLPFSRDALHWSCMLARDEEWGRMPRGVRQLWALLSSEQRAELASRLVDAWGQGAADNKDRWVLRLAGAFGDDRLVPQLKELVALWNKKHYQRAAWVVGTLGELDTTYALFTLDEIRKTGKYRDVVRGDAYQALKAAAERRDLPIQELYDELVPTLDMGPDGLVLDVGPYVYRALLMPDLSLRVIHGVTGKQSKSLPKAKKDEDPALRAVAESRFALLKKNVKPVVQQLGPRLEEAFDCGKSWSTGRWRQLFLEHPILLLVGKSLIWSGTTARGVQSFRISEDGSLIDREDEPVVLAEGEVRLWHPLESTDAEIAGWRDHFADYELTPFIVQTEAPVHGLEDEERASLSLSRFSGAKAPWGNVKRLMTKWDYGVADQDGVHIFGYSHGYPLSRIRVEIGMQECQISMSFDEDSILGDLEFRRMGEDRGSSNLLALGEVPPRLVAAVIEKLRILTKS
ncbi:DUF4132 domain-containing protein [Thiorhodococcus mannitoliphagus]|uniref:DUF4132 domain-containing protein n=1 Tax=Thiorhodococcus mannitoliphagus TaxID=329406 RepID=A0A6P1E0K5_9GAMM|nr:DUF4132 domain-containing protein [Thiorhodococcus mannitoliphagus]NEX22576.1 DUF4132 domain-containing protein [Thiorhodococcus mannitoliphagus]